MNKWDCEIVRSILPDSTFYLNLYVYYDIIIPKICTSVIYSYEYVRAINMAWGRPYPNGSWDGMLGQLQRRVSNVPLNNMDTSFLLTKDKKV